MITAKAESGWDKEKVSKVIQFPVSPYTEYPIGRLVERLLVEAVTERQNILTAEEEAEKETE